MTLSVFACLRRVHNDLSSAFRWHGRIFSALSLLCSDVLHVIVNNVLSSGGRPLCLLTEPKDWPAFVILSPSGSTGAMLQQSNAYTMTQESFATYEQDRNGEVT